MMYVLSNYPILPLSYVTPTEPSPYYYNQNLQYKRWSYSVMVITLDFESSDPGSNPGRTSIFYCLNFDTTHTTA